MKARGLSQQGLGKRIGAAQPVVGRWVVEGGPLPEGKYLVQLPGALDVSGHWLLTGRGPMAPPGLTEAALFQRGRETGWREALAQLEAGRDQALREAPGGAVPPDVMEAAAEAVDAPPAPPRKGRPGRRGTGRRRQA